KERGGQQATTNGAKAECDTASFHLESNLT
ncbi:MAG: hypothetical protein QOI79_2085, partial [Mycobacterium sp.]|nr:hypothetical protein [Mycobacterium sp.]